MGKFTYISFGDDAPREVEKVYNRMLRREQYLYEQDRKHGVGTPSYDPLLHNLADRSLTPEFQAEQAADERRQRRLTLLPMALDWLNIHSPSEYKLIMDYYFTDENITVADLAGRYGITKQALSKRIAAVRDKLREFIIAHENTE